MDETSNASEDEKETDARTKGVLGNWNLIKNEFRSARHVLKNNKSIQNVSFDF